MDMLSVLSYPIWWMLLFITIVGFQAIHLDKVIRKPLGEVSKALGTIIVGISFILMFVNFGFILTLCQLVILWIFVTPMVVLTTNLLEKIFHPNRVNLRQVYAEKLHVSEKEVERVNQLNLAEFMGEMKTKHLWLNKTELKKEFVLHPYNPKEFPTVASYSQNQIAEAVEKLQSKYKMSQQQCLVNLEQDLSEIEARSTR